MKEHTHRAPLKSMPTWETVDDWIREEIQGRFQSILEEEATAFLGRSWYERRAEVDSSTACSCWTLLSEPYCRSAECPRKLWSDLGRARLRELATIVTPDTGFPYVPRRSTTPPPSFAPAGP